jgi:HipA-like protein
MLRRVRANRYVMPFREGGSVPALVEADDLGLYVVKLRGAGQGARALVAELVAGELARRLGLHVPEIVLVTLDRELAASEPDPELCLPLEASAGLNLGLDYLPGSIAFDPIVGPPPDPVTAALTVLFDAFVTNVDRTARNTNLLWWHGRLWLIDHGASLYFHHAWDPAAPLEGSDDPFVEVRHHVLLPWAANLSQAAEHLVGTLGCGVFETVVSEIPATWLESHSGFASADRERDAYVQWLHARLTALPVVLEEAERARALSV